MQLNAVDKELLEAIAELHGIPHGAYNIRKDGQALARSSTAGITIEPKADKPGIDVQVEPDVQGQSIHIPVILTQTGLNDLVYNTFDIGAGSDVTIVAGCGIHNPSEEKSQHDGIHEFFLRAGARMRYIEKHYGQGEGTGKRVLNPVTIIHLEEGAYAELELIQVRGIEHTVRKTKAWVGPKAHLLLNERLLTHGDQTADSSVTVHLQGNDCIGELLSRSVAQDRSKQIFRAELIGEAKSKGHVACDSIIMGSAEIKALPALLAKSSEAELTHEAAIGRLAGDQIMKLMTFGMDEQEAIDTLLAGYLR